ncbi:MAG: tetraacyldisaccharide 4'-kinase [Planctomycetes bacterium]|nr:tetraacyldisaccharide 4'-kinase [Planctomycetota bacterium]
MGELADNPLRSALWPFGLLYGLGMAVRNWAFDRRLRPVHRLPVPVVSVGNLTVGGTGKTPAVLWLCALAHARGRRPGVLARGYGRAPGERFNDEGAMLQQRQPWLLQEQDPDRVAAGARLVRQGADYVVLDDGFQHRRLHRDLDVLCLDAARPFGNGQCLPAGDLREFRSGLGRAGLVLLTRADGLAAEDLAARAARLRQLAGRADLPVFPCRHAPRDVLALPQGEVLPLAALRGRRAVLLSAIARPGSFRDAAAGLGVEIVRELRCRDHHRFTAADAERAAAAARHAAAIVLATEKDAPKLSPLGLPCHVLRVELRFLGEPPSPAELLL